jgi:hypothetical protein
MTAASDPHIHRGRIMQSPAEPAPAYRASDASVTTALVSAVKPQQPVYLSHSEAAAAPVGRFPYRQTLVVGHRPQRLPSALLSVADESIAFTKRGQHHDRQSFEPAFPVGPPLCAVPPGYLTLTPRRLPYPTADASHLPHRHRPSFSRKQRPRTRAVITDDLDLFHVPPADFEIRCATHLMHAGSSSGWPDRPDGLYPFWWV